MTTATPTRTPSVSELTTGTQARALTGTQLRAAGEDQETRDGHAFTGVAVPWDTQIDLWGIREEFAPGSIVPNPAGVLVCWRHDDPIGRVTEHSDGTTGWEIDGTISRTARGDEAATLLTDGVINRMSIRFRPETFEVDESGEVPVIRHTRAIVDEVSLVPFPAYDTATITQVRQENPMPPSTTTVAREELEEVREDVTTLSRQVALLDASPSEPAGPQFRSFGHYVKLLAAGDEGAARAYEGAVSGDGIVKDAWVGDVIRLGNERQRITNLFTHTKDLPSEGMNVEYGKLTSDTTQVGVQAAEGDDLLYGKVAIESATAPVKTLGGYSELTRQAIERTTISVLDFTFRAMYLKYARAIETLTRGALTTAYNRSGASTKLAEVPADMTTQVGIVSGLIDLVEHFEDNAVNLSGILLAKDAFLALLDVPAEDKVLQVTQAPDDKLGTVTVNSIEGNISGLRVSLWPGAPTGAQLAYDETAIRTQESPGAPFRLQDENIVNLSKAFSVYGYAASYDQVPAGLVKITAPAAG